jgi:rSAM/selenodomain-associated transferase 2
MSLFSRGKWFSWPRLAALVLSAGILFFIFHKIGTGPLASALRETQPGWFIAGLLSYGLAIWLGSLRWHRALRLTDRAIHFSASTRLFFIGHFLYVALFGAVGGDLAKSAIYARNYRFGLPEVIAAAPLDRMFGLAGNIVLGCIVALIAVFNGGFDEVRNLDWHWPGPWLLGGMMLLVLIGVAIIVRRPKGESSWARTVRAFRSGSGRMVLTPKVTVPGIVAAFFSISALTAVVGLNLRAVTHADLPWARLLWTFPAITLLGSIPFTVAGAGVREVAALTLLGLYGVPPGQCVAAAVLTLVHKLIWAAVGALMLWHEQSLRAGKAGQPLPQTISIVIPTLNEARALPETVRRARALPEVREIIVVDGGSSDETRRIAEELGCKVILSPAGRGAQLRVGAARASGDVVLLLHADTWLPPQSGHAALNCLRDVTVVAGGFWKRFHSRKLLLLGSRWRCAVRLVLGRRIAGDQAMFIRRQALQDIGGVPDQPLMEDFELCRRLRKHGRLALAGATLTTSARRFEKLGVLRTYLRMWWVTTLYRFGTSASELRRIYERDA